MKVPSVNYPQVINALHRDGWVVVRQKGSHIRLQKHVSSETLKIIVPEIILIENKHYHYLYLVINHLCQN